MCLLGALAIWLLGRRDWRFRALLWLDAIGLAAYASFGAAKGLAFGVAPLPAIGMGVLTGCVGGIIRDVLAGEPSIILRPELYVTAAALGSGREAGAGRAYLTELGVPPESLLAVETGSNTERSIPSPRNLRW